MCHCDDVSHTVVVVAVIGSRRWDYSLGQPQPRRADGRLRTQIQYLKRRSVCAVCMCVYAVRECVCVCTCVKCVCVYVCVSVCVYVCEVCYVVLSSLVIPSFLSVPSEFVVAHTHVHTLHRQTHTYITYTHMHASLTHTKQKETETSRKAEN